MPALDRLRDVAALVVVAHHACHRLTGVTLAGHGYLAVDFFFLLSGFVIARSYEERWRGGLSFPSFARARLTRLYPLMMAGVLIGLLARTGAPGSPAETIWLLACAALFLPQLARGETDFPLDGVQWSLLFELLANTVHALALRRLSIRALALLMLLAASALPIVAWRHGSLCVGDMSATILEGVPRVAFSYLCGVLLWRLREAGQLPRFPATPRAVAAGLLLTLLGGEPLADAIGWAADPLIVLLVMPLLVWAGADAVAPTARRPSRLAPGALSYPLYALHLPILALIERVGGAVGLRPSWALFALYLALPTAISWLVASVTQPRRPRNTSPRLAPARGRA